MRRRLAAVALAASLTVALAPSSAEAHDLTSTTSLTRFKVPAGKTERGEGRRESICSSGGRAVTRRSM